MARTLIALLTLAAFTACSTLQPLADTQPARIREAVQPGDRVELVLADGTKHELTIESVTDDALVGKDSSRRHTIPLSSVETLAVRRMTTSDKWWTAGIVVGAIAVVAAAAGGGGSGGGDRDGPGY